eukprot:6473401-Amphidinium_carterae.1
MPGCSPWHGGEHLSCEVNASPSLTANTLDDYFMKFGMLDDVLTLIDMETSAWTLPDNLAPEVPLGCVLPKFGCLHLCEVLCGLFAKRFVDLCCFLLAFLTWCSTVE